MPGEYKIRSISLSFVLWNEGGKNRHTMKGMMRNIATKYFGNVSLFYALTIQIKSTVTS